MQVRQEDTTSGTDLGDALQKRSIIMTRAGTSVKSIYKCSDMPFRIGKGYAYMEVCRISN